MKHLTLEQQVEAEEIARKLLVLIGEDPLRGGLVETPRRFVKALGEWFEGYHINPKEVFSKSFEDGAEDYDQMILVDPIPFFSHCEHHIAPIFGTVHIGYIPNPNTPRIAGLSKFVRLVRGYAQRLQVQERLTTQIANTIDEVLEPLSVGVIIRARHFCMESRGVKTYGTETTTIALRGAIKNENAARNEFLMMIRNRG